MRHHTNSSGNGLLIGIFWIAVLGFLILGLSTCSKGLVKDYGEGERTGVVIRLSKRGMIWKSWEGMMHLGAGSTDGSANGLMVPVPWEFSTTNQSVVPALQDAAKTGKRVTLRYRQWLFHPWSVETTVDITEVEVLGAVEKK